MAAVKQEPVSPVSSVASAAPASTLDEHSPLRKLQDYYEARHGVDPSKISRSCFSLSLSHTNRHSATFTCPIDSSASFPSGKLLPFAVQAEHYIDHYGSRHWYQRKKAAIHAAAAACLDATGEYNYCDAAAVVVEKPTQVDAVISKTKQDRAVNYPNLLRIYYRETHGVMSIEECFVDTTKSTATKDSFASMFVCPVTGDLYPSGTLVQKKRVHTESGLVFYSQRRLARIAAAARALDVLTPRRQGNRCLEGEIDASMLLRPDRSAYADTVFGQLATHYLERFGLLLTQESYVLMFEKKPYRYSAFFRCPVTQLDFPNGKLAGKNYTGPWDSRVQVYKTSRRAEEAVASQVLDVIAYLENPKRRKRSFLCDDHPRDVLRKLGWAEADLQGLLRRQTEVAATVDEEPVEAAESAAAEKDDDEEVEAVDLAAAPVHSDEVSSEDDEMEDFVATPAPAPVAVKEQQPVAPIFPDDWDTTTKENVSVGDNEFVLATVPVSVGLAPVQRLLHLAAGGANPVVVPQSSSGRSLQNGEAGVQAVIDVARTWIASLAEDKTARGNKTSFKGKSIHRLNIPRDDSEETLLRGKAVLLGLADANTSNSIGRKVGIFDAATDVLDALWKTKHSKPDSETYTLYLKCIDEVGARASLEKAETIVQAMLDGQVYQDNDRLPKPNNSAINAVIQLSAQVGGTSGRYAKYVDGDTFVPDRTSFLSVLSSAIYSPSQGYEAGGFDPVFAQECIDRMAEVAEETGDTTLVPDTQVYNAPLRWSGGPAIWAETRPYARYVGWDNYELRYRAGLRNVVICEGINDLRVKEARQIDEWIESMIKRSASNPKVAPDIETYEASIQSWLRTSSKIGLERAEAIARRLLSASDDTNAMRPRLQTFHPIIAAWYHSKTDDGATKVLEWAGIASGLDAKARSDPRLVELQLSAHLAEQRRVLREMDPVEEGEEEKQKVLDAATACSRILREACGALEYSSFRRRRERRDVEVDGLLGSLLFAQCVRSWQNVATIGDCTQADRCLVGLSDAFALFESVVRTAVATETREGVNCGKHDELSANLEQLIVGAKGLGCAVLDVLAVIVQNEDEIDSARLSHTILLAEKMARTMREFEEIISYHSNQNSSRADRGAAPCVGMHSPEDRFLYRRKGDNSKVPSMNTFRLSVLRLLELLPLEGGNRGDIVRLCLLLKEEGNEGARITSPDRKVSADEMLDQLLKRSSHHRIQGVGKRE